MTKEFYEILKKHHLCVGCKEQDERTLKGFVKCAVCAEKQKQYQSDPEVKRIAREWWKSRYHTRKEAHRCARCGVKLAESQVTTLCERCARMSAGRNAKYQKNKRGKK